MAVRCTARSVLAVLLSFSLVFSTYVAQPLAQVGTHQFIEDQPGFPQYPTSQPSAPRSDPTAAAPTGAASLDFPPDRDDAVALRCGQLADEPSDTQRAGDGVVYEEIQVDQALEVCAKAAEREPARPRYQYLYGRVLDAAKRYDEAVAQYAAADRAGYGFASYALAGHYQDGAGVPKDLEQALRLYSRAGNAGIANAFDEGGAIYAQADQPDYLQARSWFERAAQGGSPDGYADLGRLYAKGLGVNKDPVIALNLFNQAASRGSPDGMYRVGLAYFDGLGVPKNPTTACEWFLRAAAAGKHPYAEGQAGVCYYNGTGVAENHETAFNLFALAGQGGLVDGEVAVADMLDRGDGHNQDSTYAVMWYEAAAAQGDAYAMTQLGAHLRLGNGVTQDEARAMQWFAKAAQQDYVPAETSLAVGYVSGQGEHNYQQAAYWFSKAADQDDAYAQLNLGVMYEKGWGVPQNLQRAKQLYARAAGTSNTSVANLAKQYFADVPDSAAPGRTSERTAIGSSKDSRDFWSVVIVGALAIGALAILTSGGSSTSSDGSGYVGTPTTSVVPFGGGSPPTPPAKVTAFPGPPPPHPCFGNIGKTLDGAAGLGFDNVCR